ncbi:class A beta-lactamase-related serine hydrolase [Nocardia panacis]|uniref:Class A beta-lactamase-related serine hydrolase n=1 Tax=Nocardia panacis TaxID=2340916 RepID=A0A3A4K5G0_9NOCA|nr:serine hydrolase domain-containing protein [Nocardia panacis]RJO75831.1 class A beta-lactamase-related serine hydrolase [Nocardia panacis]
MGTTRMRRVVRQVAVAALATTLLTGVAESHADAGPDRADLRKALQETIDSGFTGIQMRVRDQQGEWVGAAGARELGKAEQPPKDGKFRAGSATKAFVAVMVLRLVAEGKVGLDAAAADYLPDLGMDRRITVRMLLQHTSGIFNTTGEYFPGGRYEPGIPWEGKAWVDNRFHTYAPEELARMALSKPPRFAPGTDWNYSNTNYVLARLLIEKVTGSSYVDELQRRILGPLGLRDTVAPEASPEIAEPHAHAYYKYEDAGQWQTIDVSRQNPSWVSQGGDMISTTEDLSNFFAALLGGKLLPAPLLAEMIKPHSTPDPAMGYGLGLEVRDSGCVGTVVAADGGVQGYGTLLRGTLDGGKIMAASLTFVDADVAHAPVQAEQQAWQRLPREAFCGGQ